MPLNQAQINALTTTLRMLEERCDQIDAMLADQPPRRTLVQLEQDVTPDVRHAVRAELVQVRAAIAQIVAVYQLHAVTQSAWRAIDALLVTSWIDLEDSRPAKLKRYGAVDPEVVAQLDALLEQLMARLEWIRALGNTMTVNGPASDGLGDGHASDSLT
jgi:hypothetical protein